MNVFYVELESLEIVFGLIYNFYSKGETTPTYTFETLGMDKLSGVLVGVREDTYYPSVFDKAAYLLLQINTGHFFSNGNKRLALVTTKIFLGINKIRLKTDIWGKKQLNEMSKIEYKKLLEILFPKFVNFEDQENFTSADFGYYNISIIIADYHKYVEDFDSLKIKTRYFLEKTTKDWDIVFNDEK